MNLFNKTTPAEEVQNLRRKLADARASLTSAENAEGPARDELRRLAAQGEETDAAAKRLETLREKKSSVSAIVTELEAALEAAEARLTGAEREAAIEALRTQARDAMKDGEKASAEAVKTLRSFMLAWGRVEAARGTIDRCDRLATRKYEAELGVVATLPNKYQLVPLAEEGFSGGRMIREDLENLGYLLPDPK